MQATPRHWSRHRFRLRKGGFTLLELAIATPIILIAASMIASTLVASARQRTINRESAVASESIRTCFEEMRNEDFHQIFAMFNEDPFDDPNGPGTAPGSRFTIDDLEPLDGANGFIGEILFPVINTGGSINPNWELREDLNSAELETPRDLNGDSVVDDRDHSEDYRVLPILIRARWQGALGPREFRMQTILADWRSAS